MEEAVELGTSRSAVEAFANLMAAAIDVPERQLHYWLDCYYQLRLAYEAERTPADAAAPRRAVSAAERRGRMEKKQDSAEAKEPAASGFTGKKASLKQETYSKLQEARKAGLAITEMSKATNYLLSEGEILSMVNAMPMTDRKWEIMAGALKDLEAQGRLAGGGT